VIFDRFMSFGICEPAAIGINLSIRKMPESKWAARIKGTQNRPLTYFYMALTDSLTKAIAEVFAGLDVIAKLF